MLARKRFAYGPCEDIIASSGDPNVIAFIRRGSEERQGCVVVLCNTQKTFVLRCLFRFIDSTCFEIGPLLALSSLTLASDLPTQSGMIFWNGARLCN